MMKIHVLSGFCSVIGSFSPSLTEISKSPGQIEFIFDKRISGSD